MSKILVFYHKNCYDGFGAALCFWKKFKDKAEYIALEYNKPFPKKLKELKDKKVYFLDFSYDEKLMKKIASSAKELIIIDHHLSTKPFINKFNHLFSLNHSGVVLSWKYLYPKKPIPKLLLFIEDNDLWRFKYKLSKKIIAALSLYDFEFKVYDKLLKEVEDKAKRKKYLKEGEIILSFQEKIIKRLLKSAQNVNFENHKVLAVNSPVFHSEIGNEIVKQGYSFGIIYSFKEGFVRVSLRSKKNVDISKIAEKYGGGGHKNAAGFCLNIKPNSPWK